MCVTASMAVNSAEEMDACPSKGWTVMEFFYGTSKELISLSALGIALGTCSVQDTGLP